jgi:endonuclease/exonuclease/phosphatase family metal-dependent hydrolase
MKHLTCALYLILAASNTFAQPLKVATWNMAWLANEPLGSVQEVDECVKQDRAKVPIEKREPEVCRKGTPFRLSGGYAGLARAAVHYNFDIIGFQEVQSKSAVELVLGDRPLGTGADTNKVAPGTYEVAVNPDGGWQKVGIAVRKALLVPGKSLTAIPLRELGVPLVRDHRSGLDVVVPLKTGDLRVLVVHLKSACQRLPLDIAGHKNTPDCLALAQQAPVLARWIQDRQRDGKPFMMLGDFNRVLTSGSTHESCSGATDCTTKALSASLDANSLSENPILVPTAAIQQVAGCFEANYGTDLIDHILLGAGAETGFVPGSASSHPYLDSKQQPISDKKMTFFFSDHCPVSIQWKP